MVRAKLYKPGTFHDCKECGGKNMPGSPTKIDGWVDNQDTYFGSIFEYPDIETAEEALHPDYRPPERRMASQCGRGCMIKAAEVEEKLDVYELWQCGECEAVSRDKELMGNCCD